MNNIVNWEYYSSLHNVVSENDFSKAEQLAEKEVALVIGFPRWEAGDDTAFLAMKDSSKAWELLDTLRNLIQ